MVDNMEQIDLFLITSGSFLIFTALIISKIKNSTQKELVTISSILTIFLLLLTLGI